MLDTYFVFLRSRVLVGDLDIKKEHTLIEEARAWIEAKAQKHPGLGRYLSAWGDWKSPW